MDTSVNDLRVLVTAGASGIGEAISDTFAAAGARIYVCDIDTDALDAFARERPNAGSKLADVSSPEAVDALFDAAADFLGGLDVLVNNAGIFEPHPITETTYEEWQAGFRDTLEVNLVGAANATWCAVRHMLRAGGGAIVNVSSRGAFRGEPGQPAYGASKAGLIAFGQSLARDLGAHGITVTAVAPGFTETDMATEALAGERGAARRAESPLGRVAAPEEVAAAVVFLASPAAVMATGTVIDVNGASYLRM